MTITKKAIILSFLSGFLSLGLEVIWIRLFSFYGSTLPQIFSLTLALFLLGIACGSLVGKKLCQSGKGNINYIGYSFIFSSLLDCLAIALLIFFPLQGIFGIFIVSIFFCALARGVVFTIVHHLGAEQKKTGAAISNVYFANVLGCTISPIFNRFLSFRHFYHTTNLFPYYIDNVAYRRILCKREMVKNSHDSCNRHCDYNNLYCT